MSTCLKLTPLLLYLSLISWISLKEWQPLHLTVTILADMQMLCKYGGLWVCTIVFDASNINSFNFITICKFTAITIFFFCLLLSHQKKIHKPRALFLKDIFERFSFLYALFKYNTKLFLGEYPNVFSFEYLQIFYYAYSF